MAGAMPARMTRVVAGAGSARVPRVPERTVLHQVVAEHLPALLSRVQDTGLPAHVRRELEAFVGCGRFENGAACLVCDGCGERVFVPFSCKRHHPWPEAWHRLHQAGAGHRGGGTRRPASGAFREPRPHEV